MNYSNEELAAKIQSGECEIISHLWEQVHLFVWQQSNRWARAWRQTRPDIAADDFYQAGYIALCEAVETYQTERGAFLTWFSFYLKKEFSATIGKSQIQMRDKLNSALSLDAPMGGNTEGLTLGDNIPDPNDNIANAEKKEWCRQCRTILVEALNTLPYKQKEIIKARYWNSKTPQEVEAYLNCSITQVYKWEHEGLRKLRNGKYAPALRELWYGDRDLYRGTGYAAWQESGCSVQEREIIWKEERERAQRNHHNDTKTKDDMISYYVNELGVEQWIAELLFS